MTESLASDSQREASLYEPAAFRSFHSDARPSTRIGPDQPRRSLTHVIASLLAVPFVSEITASGQQTPGMPREKAEIVLDVGGHRGSAPALSEAGARRFSEAWHPAYLQDLSRRTRVEGLASFPCRVCAAAVR